MDMTGMVGSKYFLPLVPYEFVEPRLSTTATQQQGLKKHKLVTLADIFLPGKLSRGKKRTESTRRIFYTSDSDQSHSPPKKVAKGSLLHLPCADESDGAEDDFISKIESLSTECTPKPFHATEKANHWEDDAEEAMNMEYESTSRSEDVVVSCSVTAADELSDYTLVSSDSESNSDTELPPAGHTKQFSAWFLQQRIYITL